MKKLLIALTVFLPALALADSNVGVIDPLAALQGSEHVQERLSALDSEMKSDQADLQKLSAEVQSLQQKLEKDGMTMSSDKVDELRTQGQQKVIELKSLQRKLQKKSSEGQRAILEEMQPKLQKAVEKIAKDKKLDLVVNAQAVIYAEDGMDITDAVSKQLNKMK
ncbi:outer membrane protein OmpH [Alcanivorax hongdengensis A-11-3]|uniref:Outer membrane protein OmpH n=1 Tax=Alcanivorax hongdengensis A-11-3 TaxID=1177179 RepID=L0WE49_9GAMM|nr:OmpH family outer membrane protein [Alcanivorax hongdengensis]EKF75113.1 outer membrane protein OmpH [Alcanivorax hongdengensis A-11-3]